MMSRSSASSSTKKARSERSRHKPSQRWDFPIRSPKRSCGRIRTSLPRDALEELEKIQKKADDAGLDVVVYISMAFGNPYGDPVESSTR